VAKTPARGAVPRREADGATGTRVADAISMRNNISRELIVDDFASAPDLRRLATSLAHDIGNVDRRLRREGQTVPSGDAKQHVARSFWAFVDKAAQVEAQTGVDLGVRMHCRNVLAPWLWRSRFFNRSFHKPHGTAGDFRLIEWIYDLETDRCDDPTQPGIVNCLDHVYSTIPAVAGIQQRRRWFTRLLHAERDERRGGTLRVLDVACGGARHVRDFLESVRDVSAVEVTLVDQDAAALEFCRTRALVRWLTSARIETRSDSFVKLAEHLRDRRFDVIISTGLFDYLNDPIASHVLTQMASLLAPGGIVAFANFHTSDPSRVVKDWLLDWPLIYRDDGACAGLLPSTLAITPERPDNRVLCYVTGRARD
jgi:SAM-dependent methyltransferase